jgi:hypothetical protein
MSRISRSFQSTRVLDVDAVAITCEDCGRTKTWNRATLACVVGSHTTMAQLGSRLTCSHCRLRGGAGGNVQLKAVRGGG